MLETDLHRGCIKHMHNKVHRNLCVRDRPVQRLYRTYKKRKKHTSLCARDRPILRLYTECKELMNNF